MPEVATPDRGSVMERAQAMTSPQLLQRLIEITNMRRAREKEVDELREEASLIKSRIMDLFIDMGVSSMRAADGNKQKTIYLATTLWAGAGQDKTKRDVVQALEALGMDSYVSFNTQSISGFVREQIAAHEEWTDNQGKLCVSLETVLAGLPEPLASVLKLTEVTDIKIRS